MADIKKRRGETGAQIMGRVDAAYNGNRFTRGGSGLPSIMAFMGMPNLAGGPNRNGQYGGAVYPMGGGFGGGIGGIAAMGRGGGGGGNGGGGNKTDPNAPVDPATLGDLGKLKNAFPQWYIDWFNEQGKYGGVPQVSGLLNG